MNEHILKYCNDFITSDKGPQFAIFIKGPWGCGKTFFVNQLTNSLNDLGRSILRISLFGVSSTAEIDNRLFEAAHPLLSSKGAKITGSILRTVLSLGITVNAGSGEKGFTLSPNNSLLQYIGFDKLPEDNSVIIIDDFERALLSPETILGYFSNIIADTDNRVIIVGNEEKVQKSDEFKTIKEKTIGIEFLISPDYEVAIDSFVKELISKEERRVVIKKEINELNTILKCDNLRIIRQAIYNFELLLNSINGEIKYDISFLAKPFFVLFIQKSLGLVKDKKDTRDVLSAFFNMKMRFDSYKSEKEKHEKEPFWDFPFELGCESVLSVSTWESIVFEGELISRNISEEISKNIEKDKTDPLLLLFHWSEYSKEDFERLYCSVHSGFLDNKYTIPGMIIIYIQVMDKLIQRKLIPMTQNELETEVLRLIDSEKVQGLSIEQWQAMMSLDSYNEYGFSKIEGSWYSFLIDKIKKQSTSRSIQEQKKEFLSELQTPENSKSLFKSLQIHRGEGKYRNLAILSTLEDSEIEVFFDMLDKLDTDGLYQFIACFEDRYGYNVSKKIIISLVDEYEAFNKLLQLFTDKKNKMDLLYNPRYYVYEYVIQRMQELVDYLQEKRALLGDRSIDSLELI